MNYISFTFHPETNDQSEQLIAILSNLGFDGFEEDGEILKAFVPEANFDATAFNELIDSFPSFTYQKEVIEPINWNAQWESGFEPVVVNDLAAVRANFHQTIPGVKYDIIITPKMSFGTGHHATTYQMIEQMGKIDFTDKSVFDFGTGTGVLAILAEKMGATTIDAIDIDEWSIENGKENIAANNCSHINIYKADEIKPGFTYDIILANINLNVILASLPAILSISKHGTTVLLSGFLKQDEAQMTENLTKNGFQDISVFQKGDWLCISCKKH
jgi:ribosomal protein L11 methyltransferase